jgi:hypothetical protein
MRFRATKMRGPAVSVRERTTICAKRPLKAKSSVVPLLKDFEPLVRSAPGLAHPTRPVLWALKSFEIPVDPEFIRHTSRNRRVLVYQSDTWLGLANRCDLAHNPNDPCLA